MSAQPTGSVPPNSARTGPPTTAPPGASLQALTQAQYHSAHMLLVRQQQQAQQQVLPSPFILTGTPNPNPRLLTHAVPPAMTAHPPAHEVVTSRASYSIMHNSTTTIKGFLSSSASNPEMITLHDDIVLTLTSLSVSGSNPPQPGVPPPQGGPFIAVRLHLILPKKPLPAKSRILAGCRVNQTSGGLHVQEITAMSRSCITGSAANDFDFGEILRWHAHHMQRPLTLELELTILTAEEEIASPHPSEIFATIQEVVSRTIDGADPVDVRIDAFSRRTTSGEVSGANHPRSVYASTSIIKKSCGYFQSSLSFSLALGSSFDADKVTVLATSGRGYTEAQLLPLSSASILPAIDSYDYEEDSDLDDMEEDDMQGEKQDELTECTCSPSDQPPITEEPPLATVEAPAARFLANDVPHNLSTITLRLPTSSGQIIQVPNVAYRTMRAFVWYVYTAQIKFAPLYDYEGLDCSARSMFRLADMFGHADLRARAKKHIISNLSVENIIAELFRPFTAMYPEIMAAELAFVARHRHVIKKTKEWGELIDSIVSGEITHSKDVVRAIMNA